jgi:hypothetical protein
MQIFSDPVPKQQVLLKIPPETLQVTFTHAVAENEPVLVKQDPEKIMPTSFSNQEPLTFFSSYLPQHRELPVILRQCCVQVRPKGNRAVLTTPTDLRRTTNFKITTDSIWWFAPRSHDSGVA